MSSSASDPRRCAGCAKAVIYLGIAEAVVFTALKVSFGMAFGSRALMAASLYSVQDLIASLVALIGVKVSARPPDKDHPYGHGKVEYLVVVMMSVLLLLGIVALMITALSSAFRPAADPQAPGMTALWLALLCGTVCWLFSGRAGCAARSLNSPALLSCSEHLHSDFVAMAAVVVSVIGARLGFVLLDHIVAVAEAMHIVFVSGRMLGTAINGLMDVSAEPGLIERLRRAIGEIEAVLRVRQMRARWAGQSLMAQVSVEVKGQMKVTEADELRVRIEEVIRAQGSSKALVQVGLVPGDAPAGRAV